MMTNPLLIDQYIDSFDDLTKNRLRELKEIIATQLPNAEQRISYAIPAFWDSGYIVYFAGYAKHVGLYPVHNVKELFGDRLNPYISGKATARFSHNKPLPKELIEEIVSMLDEQNKLRKKG